jgi:hypothetical protein
VADHVNEDTGLSWPKVETIAFEAGMSESTARLALRSLVDGGWLEVVSPATPRDSARMRPRLDGRAVVWPPPARVPGGTPLDETGCREAALRVPGGGTQGAGPHSPECRITALRVPGATPEAPKKHSEKHPQKHNKKAPMGPSAGDSQVQEEVQDQDHQPRGTGEHPPRDLLPIGALCVEPATEESPERPREQAILVGMNGGAGPSSKAEIKSAPVGMRPGATPPLPGFEAIADPAGQVAKVDPCAEVWAAFLEERGKWLGAARAPVLDDKRRTIIRARFKDFDIADLCAAARGIWRDDFHISKDHKFATIEVGLRDTKNVERYRELGAVRPVDTRRADPRQRSDHHELPPRPPVSPERAQELLEQYLPEQARRNRGANGGGCEPWVS